MNPYRHVTVAGDARTWHTPIIAEALADAVGAEIPEDRLGEVITAKGGRLQLDLMVAIHPSGPREERKSNLTQNSRHRYHHPKEDTRRLAGMTRRAIERWAFNERRHVALGDGDCALPENQWAVHVPLIARRYADWRGLSHMAFLHNMDEQETFEAFRNGDRVARFTAELGTANLDVTWDRNRVVVPILIPHTLDADILGQPISRIVQHPVLDDALLVVTGLTRRKDTTVIEMERAWTTIGDAP